MSVPLIVLVGPTATGKSRLAVDVALAMAARGLAAEVVNADSMLVYRRMDIGTAKPTEEERAGVPHHLIDIVDVTERASVAEFQRLARDTIAGLRARAAVPVLVGGSALYTRAIVDRFEFPGSDPEVRARWEAELERVGAHALHARLAEVAPESAAKIEPGNGRHTVRALEVLKSPAGARRRSGPMSWTTCTSSAWKRAARRVGCADRRAGGPDVAGRHRRRGPRLLERGLRDGTTAVRAIGYRQVVDFLDGAATEEEAKAAVKRAARPSSASSWGGTGAIRGSSGCRRATPQTSSASSRPWASPDGPPPTPGRTTRLEVTR